VSENAAAEDRRTLAGKGNPVWHGLLWYELRELGLIVLLTPLLVVIGVAGFAGIMALSGEETATLSQILTQSMELLFPLAAGLIAATVVAADPGVEWQLTMPTPYRLTVSRRLGLVIGWSSIVALANIVVLRSVGRWTVPEEFVISQLTWLAPLLAWTALGSALSLLLRNRSASAGVLGGIFIIEIVLHDAFLAHAWSRPWYMFATSFAPGAGFWLANRLALIGLSMALYGAALLLLGMSEMLLIGGEQ
jgi:hypothetical protein